MVVAIVYLSLDGKPVAVVSLIETNSERSFIEGNKAVYVSCFRFLFCVNGICFLKKRMYL